MEYLKGPLACAEMYLQNHLVLIIHEYPMFGLTKIKYKDDNEEFIIDSKLLTKLPNNEHTINLALLGGL